MVLLSTLLLAASAQLPVFQDPAPNRDPWHPNDPGILEPVWAELAGIPVRTPNSHQVDGHSDLLNLVGKVRKRKAKGQKGLTGNTITRAQEPHRDLAQALEDLEDGADRGNQAQANAAALRVQSILLGTTNGEIYDGFSLLNSAQGAYLPDHEAGLERTKRLRDSGYTVTGVDGVTRRVWEANVSVLWHDDDNVSDTAFLLIPLDAHPLDQVMIHYTVYSLEREDFAPATFLNDAGNGSGPGLPFKGYDATWVAIGSNMKVDLTVAHGALSSLEGVQLWGWRSNPERSTWLQVVREIHNVSTGQLSLDAKGQALMAAAAANDLSTIGASAPERKAYDVVQATLAGAPLDLIADMLSKNDVLPRGIAKDWIDLMSDRRELPPEAMAQLLGEGVQPGVDPRHPLGPYDAVAAIVNHEYYLITEDDFRGEMPPMRRDLPENSQGQELKLRLYNLDNAPHRVRLEDYGAPLWDDIKTCRRAPAGGHSLEVFSCKPLWGATKQAELQWRTAWGYRSGLGVLQQYDVYPRAMDQAKLLPYADGYGQATLGWSYPAHLRGGEFRFNPPLEALGRPGRPATDLLRDADGQPGLVLGKQTVGFGPAKMPGGDLAALHPGGLLNFDSDGDGFDDQLVFPDWLRNPDPAGGDLILPEELWQPFLFLNPQDGGLLLDPAQPELGLWADATYAFGAPMDQLSAQTVEWIRPRASGQAVWLVDGGQRVSAAIPIHLEERYEIEND